MKSTQAYALLFLFSFTSQLALADQEADRGAISAAADSYSEAFNSRDAQALAAHWSPEALYTNPLTGKVVEGRDAIRAEFESILESVGELRVELSVESIEFVSPSVAIEEGVATLLRDDAPPSESYYSAVHVKHAGEWLLDRVTEQDAPEPPPSNYEKLKQLEWLVGEWVDGDDSSSIQTSCQWTRNKNFLTRSFTVSIGDSIDMAGMQVIGWDAAAESIRSWTFDSDGGFAEGVWSESADGWHIAKTGTLPDGGRSSSVNIVTKVDDNQFKWRSVNRVVDGQVLPNLDEVLVVRAR